jgi:hypothetical protein
MEIVNNCNIANKEILFCKPIKYENKFKFKVNVIDKNSKKINKLGIITPMLELNINWKNLKYQQFKAPIDPLIGINLDFYNLISYIENLALDKLIEYFGDNCNFKSILSDVCQTNDEFIDSELFTITMINLRLLKTTNVFDVNGKKTNVENLELNGTINYKFLLELTDLWYDNDTCLCGCNFNITQIKHFPLYYEYDLIIDENNYECQGKGKGLGKGKGKCNGKSFQPLLTPPPPKACIPINCDINSTTIEVSKDITPITQNKPINFVLDANMLKNALSKLKKPPI